VNHVIDYKVESAISETRKFGPLMYTVQPGLLRIFARRMFKGLTQEAFPATIPGWGEYQKEYWRDL